MMVPYNTQIVLLGVTCLGASAGVIGSFAILQRRALLGDALAHATLPGLCIGFMILGERNLAVMLLGALISGLLGIGVINFLIHRTRVRLDASIGIVLSVFFGLGIVLLHSIQNMQTSGSKAGLNSFILGKTAGIVAQDVWLIAGSALLGVVISVLLFKEFLVVSFDVGFAKSQGWPVRRLDLLMTGLIALVVVIGLSSVGVVMIAAMLIIPGVSARFWTDRLATLVLVSAIFGILMGFVGTMVSATMANMPAGPIITLSGTAIFVLSLVFAPKRGLIRRLAR